MSYDYAMNAADDAEIKRLRAEIERLRADLAEADALIATHQFTLDPSPPETWPKGSILARAVGRHVARLKEGK